MKRYFAPALILVLLLLGGGTLWLQNPPAPAAEPPYSSDTEPVSQSVESQSLPDSTVSTDSPPLLAADTAEAIVPEPAVPSDTAAAGPPHAANSTAPAPPKPAEIEAPSETVPAKSEPESSQSPASSAAEQSPEIAAPSTPDPSALTQDLLIGINKERAEAGASALTLDPSLSDVAALRASECTVKFGHTRPDGSLYHSAVDSAGISHRYLGENLATGYTSAQSVIQGWSDSGPHHDNIIHSNFTKVGIGLAENPDPSYPGYTWVAIFCG